MRSFLVVSCMVVFALLLAGCGSGETEDLGDGTTADTLAAIKQCYADSGYILDPHTAVGYHIAHQHLKKDEPMVCLATAHPAKFGDAVLQAIGEDVAHHPILDALNGKPTRCDRLPAEVDRLKAYLLEHVS